MQHFLTLKAPFQQRGTSPCPCLSFSAAIYGAISIAHHGEPKEIQGLGSPKCQFMSRKKPGERDLFPLQLKTDKDAA